MNLSLKGVRVQTAAKVVIADVLVSSHQAAASWRQYPLKSRLRIVRRVRRLIAADAVDLATKVGLQRPIADTLTAEILPLLEAARFLERTAARLLAPERLGRRGRPLWLFGVHAEIHREPCGTVLVIAPSNYPLFLAAVQILQALVAGNAVCTKPASGHGAPLQAFAALLRQAGLPDGALMILDDSVSSGIEAVRAGFDRVVLTGSAETGRKVLRAAAETLTPCTMELSGDDPVFVLPGADLPLVAACIGYGLRLNDGHTCIAPRRVFAPAGVSQRLETLLAASCPTPPPVIAVQDAEEALCRAMVSPYALGAAIFGPVGEATAFAARVKAGCVVINDVIVPTADPRVPFGGRGLSGFGVTRGGAGLLEMTVIKTVAVRRGRFRPHLNPQRHDAALLFSLLIVVLHGGYRRQFAVLSRLLRAIRCGFGKP